MPEDVLEILPFDKWPLLQAKLKFSWPKYSYHYYWIENAISWKKKRQDIEIQIYCPRGNLEKGTFVGITNWSMYVIIAFTLDASDGILTNILKNTEVINWNQGVYLAAIHESYISAVNFALEHLKQIKGIEINFISPANFYYKSAEECSKVEICIPQECYLKPLNPDDVFTIHSVWPHREEERPDLSTKFLRTMIEMNGGIGLYLKENNSLVSWAIHNEFHGLGMVQTLQEHEKKGYARIVIKSLTKKLGDRGLNITLFIVQGNTISETMFMNLGWKKVSAIAWIILKRKLNEIIDK